VALRHNRDIKLYPALVGNWLLRMAQLVIKVVEPKRLTVFRLRMKVNRRARKYGLSPLLPELVAFKAELPELISDPFGMPEFAISSINPRESCGWHDGVFVMYERMFGGILQIWTIANFHIPDIYQRLSLIVVNRSGMHLYDAGGKELAVFLACKCDPHRLADPGNRLQNAAIMVEHYTGTEVDWRELVGKYSATYEKDDAGNWQTVELSLDPATA
jgi:hypothetical protein